MNQSDQVVVVIPVYKSTLRTSEEMSLQQGIKVLGNRPLVLIKPQSLSLDGLMAQYPQLQCVSFDDAYFRNVAGYNRLLTSEAFYKTFEAYAFMLIYQLDAFVFRDELDHWCALNYDYIGAPHVAARHRTAERGTDPRFNLRKVILNGGLSLRKIDAMQRFLWIFRRFYGSWRGNEDGLFSLAYPRLYLGSALLTLPSWDAALPFAFDLNPVLCYTLNGHQLPMGCHAFERYNYDFWRPFFNQCGYPV